MTAKSKSAKFYKENKASREAKKEYDKKFNAKPSEVKKRTELNKYNRDKGTYGNNDHRDASHHGSRIDGFLSESKNRGSKSNAPGDKRARGKKK